ncbi:cyanophycinase [Pelomonas sp. SE-A7]|uniref:cyanophycinase n=1 Tax=Pelomonas sp. SE-A7 TaxID=3054953 RepID=UPI00259CB34D|nr:cyanophycinase [Pelomonas sp. SE-A7]MDM4765691.1 cyanophycinase [Pelomonas sp. SE-A7]
MLSSLLTRRCFAVLALSALAAGAHAETPQGTVIAIGGALKPDNAAIWQRVVDAAGGPGARIAVFATASGNPQRAAAQIVEPLTRHGARPEVIPVAPGLTGVDLHAALNDPVLIEKVRSSGGVFFSGGGQELIVNTLQPKGEPTEMLKAIWAVYRRGGVVAGTSAGAAIMSRTMFRDAADGIAVLQGRIREGREWGRGLGFVESELFVDQHFLKRGRIGRILPLMQARGLKLGLGVEEDSAAVLRGSQVEVIGARGVLLVDLGEASSDDKLGAFNIRNVKLSYLDRGDRHDLATGRSTPSEQKLAGSKVDPRAADFEPRFQAEPFFIDMLADNVIVRAMTQLIDSPHAELRGIAFKGKPGPQDPQPDLGFEFRLHKAAESLAWSGADGAGDYTLLGLRLDVQPVQIRRPFYAPLSASR